MGKEGLQFFHSSSLNKRTLSDSSQSLSFPQILYGNLAPEGSVAKITGKEGLQFRGLARVFDSEEEMLAVVAEDPQQLKVWSLLNRPQAVVSM